ncbi:MAG: thermonuclease family protein [Geminicoccaceae bacterium]|nr:thermonuclease family protein [Geminicoccaceae bacterium]MDW8369843.1 thermonuclease family protein [Geminicoccaceae bacterium]
MDRARMWARRQLLEAAAPLAAAALLPLHARAARADALAVAAVEGPDRLRLEDGRIARLLGYVVPGDLSPAPPALSFVEPVRRRLASLVEAGGLALEVVGVDRYERVEVVARSAEGRLVAAVLVEEGLAWAWADGLPLTIGRALLEAEGRARAAGRGLWALPSLAEQEARGIAAEPVRFVVAVGTVARIGRGERFLYLDLGPDRRGDLSVRIPTGALSAFRKAGLRPDRLEGRRLRVRGWLFAARGPMIETEDPLSIEVLG